MASAPSSPKKYSEIVASTPKPATVSSAPEPDTMEPFSMTKYHQQVVANAHSFTAMVNKPKHKPCGEVCQFKPPQNRCFGCQASAKDRHSCEGYEISMRQIPNIYGQYVCFCNECPKCEKSYYWIYEVNTKTTEGGPCDCGYGKPERI